MKPYKLGQAQALVNDAILRSETRHRTWRAMEILYRTGNVQLAQNTARAADGSTSTLDMFDRLDQTTVNMVLPHANIMLASIVANDPRYLVEPVGGGEEAELAARVTEHALHHFWRRARATRDIADATWDMTILGNGFSKVGWAFEEGEVEKPAAEFEAEVARQIEADRRLAVLGDREPTAPEVLAERVSSVLPTAFRDEPYVEYVSPYDVFVPPNARRMWESRWVAHRLSLPIDEVEGNDSFKIPKGGLNTDGTAGVGREQAEWRRKAAEERDAGESGDALDTVTLFEFYDLRSHTMLVFQLDAEEPLFSGPIPWAHKYPPFVHFANYRPNGTEFWAFGDLESIAHIQGMLNEFVTEQVGNVRRSGNKYMVDSRAITPELIAALESDEPDVVAAVDLPGSMTLSDVVMPVQRLPLPGDVYAGKAEMEEYLRKIMGVSEFGAGGSGADRMSATAAALVDGVSTMRATSKVASVEAGAAEVGQLIVLLMQEFLTEEVAVRVSGTAGAAWPKVSSEDIAGDFLVTVEGGSTKSVNPATRENRGMRSLTEVAPMLAQLGFDPVPAVRAGLRDLGYDPDLVLKPAPQPEAPEGAPEAQPPATGPADVGGGDPTAMLAQAAGAIAL